MKPTTTNAPDELVLGTDVVTNVVPITEASADPDPKPATADTPAPTPKRGRPPKTTDEKSAGGRPSNRDRLTKQLAEQYTMLGTLLSLVAPNVGRTIIVQADSCAESLSAWAETNPKVRKAIERTVNGAGAIGVLAAHAPIALAVVVEVTSKGEPTDSPPTPGGITGLFGFGVPAA